MWIHTCFISQHCSIWREITSLSLDCLTFELFLFPWSSNRLQFLRSVAESMHNTQHVNNMHRLFDSSWSRSSVLETSTHSTLTCFDFSIVSSQSCSNSLFSLNFQFSFTHSTLHTSSGFIVMSANKGSLRKIGYCHGLFYCVTPFCSNNRFMAALGTFWCVLPRVTFLKLPVPLLTLWPHWVHRLFR